MPFGDDGRDFERQDEEMGEDFHDDIANAVGVLEIKYIIASLLNVSVINNISLLPFPLIFKICTLSPPYYEFRANPQGSSKVVPACSRLSMSTFNKQSVVHTIKIDLSQSASRVD